MELLRRIFTNLSNFLYTLTGFNLFGNRAGVVANLAEPPLEPGAYRINMSWHRIQNFTITLREESTVADFRQAVIRRYCELFPHRLEHFTVYCDMGAEEWLNIEAPAIQNYRFIDTEIYQMYNQNADRNLNQPLIMGRDELGGRPVGLRDGLQEEIEGNAGGRHIREHEARLLHRRQAGIGGAGAGGPGADL